MHDEQKPETQDDLPIEPEQTGPAEAVEPEAPAAQEPTQTTDDPVPVDPVEDSAEDPPEQAAIAEPEAGITNQKKKRFSFRPELILFPPLRRKLGSKARLVAIVILCLLVALIGGGSYWSLTAKNTPATAAVSSSFKLAVTKFKLVSTSPALNATNVNTATPIVLTFSQPVTPSKLTNNMFITPTVTGTYKQGSSPDQVIFTPTTPLKQGTKFGVMINGTYQSNSGTQLGSPYEYGFTTSIPSDDIDFQDQNGLIDNVASLASGQKESFTMYVGDDVGTGANITLYKGTTADMLRSLVYTTTSVGGSSSSNYSDLSVSTTGLQQVATQTNITNNGTYNVQEPDGLYVAVATDATGKQVGLIWIDFSSFGVLARQDDQKLLLDAQAFSDQSDVSANVQFYNLLNGVNSLGQTTVNGLTTKTFPYTPSVDFAVATYGTEVAVIPINELDSGGDIRVDQDLSTAQDIYAVTDKSTYQVGDDIKYAGYVRNDNDAQYTNPGSGAVKLYVAQYAGGTELATTTASIGADGMISGSITPEASWLTAGDAFDQFHIYVAGTNGETYEDEEMASFTLTAQQNNTTNVTVSFSQSSYLANQPITATITATNSSGKPLANTTLALHIFSQDYYENDPSANLTGFGSAGNELPTSPVNVQLNANGQATYTVNTSTLPDDGTSQLVTLQANVPGQIGVGAAGGDSAIVHQGNAVLTFGTDRQQVPSGSDLTSEVYATDLKGNVLANTKVSYVLTDSESSATLATGSSTTNSSGMASIDIPSAKLGSGYGDELEVSVEDASGNSVDAQTYYDNHDTDGEASDTSGVGLLDLNVTGAPTTLSVGQQVSLDISAPSSIKAMVTMDRGRIYNATMVQLNKGDNTYSFAVTSALAPSFTLTFNYFLNGVYHSEGVYFSVSDPTQAATVKLVPTSQSVSAGQPTTVQINTLDNNGSPLATNLIVDIESTNGYDLSTSVNPDIYSVLYNPRPIMTSSTSSLSPVGSGGGRCGGGSGDFSSFANAVGTTLDWQPDVQTNASGQASVTFTPPSGSWTISVYAMSAATQVGSATTTITAN